MRDPWFSIVDVIEERGRSIADIAAEVARECGVNLNVMRSPLMLKHVVAARDAALAHILQERPDAPSSYVAAYFNREASTIRHAWRKLRRAA